MKKAIAAQLCLLLLALRLAGQAAPLQANSTGTADKTAPAPVVKQLEVNATNSSSTANVAEQQCIFVGCECNDQTGPNEFNEVICKNISTLAVLPAKAGNRAKIALLDLGASGISPLPEGIFRHLDINDIDLSHNNFSSFHLNAFNGIHRLLGLDLTNNQLSDLGEHLFKPVYATVNQLKFNLNQLNRMDPAKLGRVLSSFSNLQILYLKSNNLQAVPNMTALTMLTDLALESNQLETVLGPDGSFRIPGSVLDLKLENNRITVIDKGMFANLVNLKYLDLSSNQINLITRHAFDALKKLRHLRVKKNYLKQIPSEALYPLANLERLDMSNQNALMKELNDYAFDRRLNMSTLPLLVDLSGNKITSISNRTFCLRNNEHPYARIHDLDLSGNHLTEFKACVAYQLFSGLPANSSLRINFKGSMTPQEFKLPCNCEVTHAAYFGATIGECTDTGPSTTGQLDKYTCLNAYNKSAVEHVCKASVYACPTDHPVETRHYSFKPAGPSIGTGYVSESIVVNETASETDFKPVKPVGHKRLDAKETPVPVASKAGSRHGLGLTSILISVDTIVFIFFYEIILLYILAI